MAVSGPRTEVEAYAAELASLVTLLRGLSAEDWSSPTRCLPMDVRTLTAHVLGQLRRLAEMRDMPFIDTEPVQDRWSWWDYDPEEEGPMIVRRAEEVASDEPPGPIADAFEQAVTKAIDAIEFRYAKGDPVVGGGSTMIRLSEYVATRVLEATIHGMDLRDALGQAPSPSPEAMAVTGDILRGLLGVDLRPAITDERLALIGTGRERLDDAERKTLGPLVEKFPLLA